MSMQVGDIVEGVVENITNYGAFIKFENGEKGLVHISEVSNKYVGNILDVLQLQQKVNVKILSNENGKISLSIKQAEPTENVRARKSFNRENRFKNNSNNSSNEPKTFEDILSKFLKDSEERQSDIKRDFESKRSYSGKRA